MKFTPEWIAQLKQNISLIDIASENVDLKKSGNNRFMGRCPFHGDRSPSFSVNKDFYYCFGCKETGDAISFMTKLHGLSFEEACEDLAEKAGIKIPEGTYASSAEEQAMYQRRARVQKAARVLHFASLQYYHHNLLKGKTPALGKLTSESSPLFSEAAEYIKKRGISGKTIEDFQIGVSTAKYDGLTNFLNESKAPLDIARDFGLIRASQKQTGDYDVFRERILFPLIDVRGRVCGFGGRILPSCDKKDAEVKVAKYYNSAESDLFHKSKFLYGLYQAKRAIREEEVVIVVEGNFDVIAMHQHGFENTVATCGTSLTEDHLKTLSRLAKKIIVFFDQDAAGIGATEKAMELGLRNGVLFYGIPYDSKLDPDEFLLPDLNDSEKPNAKKMKKWIESSFPLLDHQIETLLKKSEGNIEERSIAVKRITQWLESFTDEVGRAMRVDQLIQKWRIPSIALGKLGQVAGQRSSHQQGQQRPMPPRQDAMGRPMPTNPRPVRRAPFTPYDRQLLHFLVKFEKFGPLFLEAKKQIPEKDSLSAFFDDTELRAWAQRVVQNPEDFSKLKLSPESLLGESISQELQSVIMESILQEQAPGDEIHLEVLLKKGIHKIWVRFSHELKHQMAAADVSQDMEKFKELSQQFLDLQRKLKEFEGSYVSGK